MEVAEAAFVQSNAWIALVCKKHMEHLTHTLTLHESNGLSDHPTLCWSSGAAAKDVAFQPEEVEPSEISDVSACALT